MIWAVELWSRIKGWAALAGVALIAVGVAFLRGRTAGIQHIEAEQARRRIEAMNDRKDVDDEVANLGSNDVDERFARWMRDDDR